MKPFRLRVPATSANIGPGFDCLGVAVGLYLRLECRPSEDFAISLSGYGADTLPRDAGNLIARALVEGSGFGEVPPVHLQIDNQVPTARGLGSSSAATVAGLAAGHILAGDDPSELDLGRLLQQATDFEGHPDNVAPAIFGDLTVSGFEEDRVISIQLEWPEDLHFVVVIPELRIRTESARRSLPETIDFADAVVNSSHLARLMAALHTRHYTELRTALADRLHQPYRLPLAKGLPEVLETLATHPLSLGGYLSGSGPTLVALCQEAEQGDAIGKAGVERFREFGVSAGSKVLKVDPHGLQCEWL